MIDRACGFADVLPETGVAFTAAKPRFYDKLLLRQKSAARHESRPGRITKHPITKSLTIRPSPLIWPPLLFDDFSKPERPWQIVI